MSKKQSNREDFVEMSEDAEAPSESHRLAIGKVQPGNDGLITAMGGATVQPGTYRCSPKASSFASGARNTPSAPEQRPSGAESSGGSDSSEENSDKNTGNE